MRRNRTLAIAGILVFILSGCSSNVNTDLDESFSDIKQVTPIEGATIESMEVNASDNQDNYLTVKLNGIETEAWCIEWNEEEAFGIQQNAKLYSTENQKTWQELNYFMSIKEDLLAEDQDLTPKDIQVVIWSLVDNPSFNVDKIAQYKNIDPRIYKDGKARFSVQKVKSILSLIKKYFEKWGDDIEVKFRGGVIVIKNDGQTLIINREAISQWRFDL